MLRQMERQMNEQPRHVPEASWADSAHTVIRGALSCVPGAGGAAAEIFSLLVAQPVTARINEFLQQMANDIHELQLRGINVDALKDDPQFGAIVMQAHHSAIRTVSVAKREALRNCVLNSAIKKTRDARRAEFFMAAIDTMTDVHIEILRTASRTTVGAGSRSVPQLVLRTLGLAPEDGALVDKAWNDMSQLGLVPLNIKEFGAAPLDAQRLLDPSAQPIATPFARELLAFISSPALD
jgi:hypothetical protein